MPASSRKRNKGKDRKAKKAANEEASKRIQIYNDWQDLAKGKLVSSDGMLLNIPCNHGLVAVLPDESHPVSRFISDYFSVDVNLREILQRHPEVQNDNNYRKMAADILTRIQANWLLSGDTFGGNFPKGIMILENYGKTGNYVSTVYRRDIGEKNRDLGYDNRCKSFNIERDLLKFYRKRMSCKCLKKMHLEARRTIPKLGECNHCGEVKERRLFMVCSRCMVNHYCSKDCQVAALPRHRGICDNFNCIRQQSILHN